MTTNDDDDENGTTTRGRPNAYFAKIKQEQEEELEEQERGDTYNSAFRGVRPPPHGGVAHVRPGQVLGTEDLCWCGQPAGHDWPGKRVGARHPKVEENSMPTETGTMPNLDRKDLRAFHRRLQDFIITCVNGDGIRYRTTKNSVILYPPDGTTPMSVYARNTDRQLRQLQRWYLEHVYVESEEDKVDKVALTMLAKAKNDPVEHPAKDKEPEAVSTDTDDEPVESTNEDWKPWVRSDHTVSDTYEVNADGQIRCRLCLAEGKTVILEPRSTGGHIRMHHTDTSDMHSPEARAKANATLRERKTRNAAIHQAIDLLASVSGYKQVDTTELENRIGELEKQLFNAQEALAAAESGNADLVAVTERAEAAEKRAEEAEAKLALIREATGL